AALFPKRLVHGWTPKGTRPRLATAFVRRSTAMIEAVNLVLNGPDHGERKLKSLLSQPDDLLFEAVDVGGALGRSIGNRERHSGSNEHHGEHNCNHSHGEQLMAPGANRGRLLLSKNHALCPFSRAIV